MQTDISSIINTPDFKELLKKAISEEVARFVKEQEEKAGKVSLIERIARVEEALLAQGEVIKSLQREMDKRFDAMDARFAALQREMDRRFEVVDARFAALQREMDRRFEVVDARFEAMDARFEAMDARFAALQREMDKRFDSLERRFSFMQWLMAGGFGFIAILVTVINFLK